MATSAPRSGPSAGAIRRARARFRGVRRIYAYRWLARSMRQNLKLDEVLALLADHASDDGKNPNAVSALAYGEWARRVEGGGSIAVAMAGWVPANHATLIEAGQAADNIARALEICAYLEESAAAMRRALVAAVTYPSVLVAMMLALVWACNEKVLPQFEALVPREEWSGLAAYLPAVFDFVLGWGLAFVVLFFVFLAVAVRFLLPRWVSPLRDRLEWMVVFRQYRTFQGALFLVGLSELLATRVAVPDALRILCEHAEPWLVHKVRSVQAQLNEGIDLADALWTADPNFPARGLNRELRMVLRLQGFAPEMQRMATQWVSDTVTGFQAFGTTLRGIGIAGIGVVLGSLILTMAQLSEQAGSAMRTF